MDTQVLRHVDSDVPLVLQFDSPQRPVRISCHILNRFGVTKLSLARKIVSYLNRHSHWIRYVRFDADTGFLYYFFRGKRIYIKTKSDYLRKKKIEWLCENLYFKHYLPVPNDTVVDVGAGYGEEAVFLNSMVAGVTYLGIEVQPVIYECLCNTYRGLSGSYVASPYLIDAGSKKILVSSEMNYEESSAGSEGYIEVPTQSWGEFAASHDIQKISLLKMNIEGGEIEFLNSIQDFSFIERIVVSCHDFRANAGHGEFYRTKKHVIEILENNGYKLTSFHTGLDYADDWLFAER